MEVVETFFAFWMCIIGILHGRLGGAAAPLTARRRRNVVCGKKGEQRYLVCLRFTNERKAFKIEASQNIQALCK